MTITINALAISNFLIIVFIGSLAIGLVELFLQSHYNKNNKVMMFFREYTPFQNINVISGFLFLLYLMFLGAAYLINKANM